MSRLHDNSIWMRSAAARGRGGVYLVVLAFCALVTVISIGSILASRIQSKLVANDMDVLIARQNAQAALEMGRLIMETDSNWRTNHPNGVWIDNRPLASGAATLTAANPNGEMNRSSLDPVILTAIGVKGSARQKVQVTFHADSHGMDCLKYPLCFNGAVEFNDSAISSFGQTVAGNSTVSASAGYIKANVEAVGAITGATYYGTKTAGKAKSMPDPTRVYDSYIAQGTVIGITSLPLSSGYRQLTKCVLSPNSNPFGAGLNPKGVYVIDCLGQEIAINSCRIVGTLVLINPGSSSLISGSVHWTPAVSNYPALLLKGSIRFNLGGDPLTEDVSLTNNFNPVGTPYPYPAGMDDSDYLDSYPSRIDGLIYCNVAFQTSGKHNVVGMLMGAAAFKSYGALNLLFDSSLYGNPPPGFWIIKMAPGAGAYKRQVD